MALTKTYSIKSAKIDPANEYVRLVEHSIEFSHDAYPGVVSTHSGVIDVGFAQLRATSPLDDYILALGSFYAPQMVAMMHFHEEQLRMMYLANSLQSIVPDAAPEPTDDEINAERTRRIDAGATLLIPGYGLIALQGRDEDQRNLNARAAAATLKLQAGDTSLMIFRDANNVIHELTPEQQIMVFAIGSSWVESQYKASWAIKDKKPVPRDYTDDKYWK